MSQVIIALCLVLIVVAVWRSGTRPVQVIEQHLHQNTHHLHKSVIEQHTIVLSEADSVEEIFDEHFDNLKNEYYRRVGMWSPADDIEVNMGQINRSKMN